MSETEGPGPRGSSAAWRIVRGQAQEPASSYGSERVAAVASIGTRMIASVTRDLGRYGALEQLDDIAMFHAHLQPDPRIARLLWLKRAIQDKVQSVCGTEAPSFVGKVPQGEIPGELGYVGSLIDDVDKGRKGEETEPFLTLQLGPNRGRTIEDINYDLRTLLETREDPHSKKLPLGLIEESVIRGTQLTAFGVKLESVVNFDEGIYSYSIVPNQQKT